ncbi:hypothetical protein [Streptomyces sp. NPDC002994]|uniref:hypothetical protein n=1 Tax=Streptomyces sp. NPDC002994 TaxID=3154441 RepID=UPI0033A0FF17
MRVRFRCAALLLPLSLSLAGCASEEEPAAAVESKSPGAKQPPEPAAAPEPPESPEDFLDLAEEAMAKEGAWTFSVKGEEALKLQGQRSAASYQATVKRSLKPDGLHSRGDTTSSKGTTRAEELYVVDGTAHLKEGNESWKKAAASSPEMKNKIEDPVAAIEEFREYARAAGDGVTLTRTDGTIQLRVGSGSQKLVAVRDRAYVKKAVREFGSTAEQLRQAGIPVNDAQLTLSGLEETLLLDANTYRVKSHSFDFGFLVPYGGQDIMFEQKVRQENQGSYDGKIELPADLR